MSLPYKRDTLPALKEVQHMLGAYYMNTDFRDKDSTFEELNRCQKAEAEAAAENGKDAASQFGGPASASDLRPQLPPRMFGYSFRLRFWKPSFRL